MARMITCECGYQARGLNDDELLMSIMSHIESVHPDRIGVFSSDDLLSMAVSVDD
jgi:predicted small metal-binding protein